MDTRILIVEDDLILLKHLARLFMREGYVVSTAATRAVALEQLSADTFDILLLDMKLPDGNGLDLLAELGPRCPPYSLLMTAFSTDESESHAQQLNVRHLLRKPVDLLELLNIVRAGSFPRP